jgi:hypothetical protein
LLEIKLRPGKALEEERLEGLLEVDLMEEKEELLVKVEAQKEDFQPLRLLLNDRARLELYLQHTI